MAHTNRQTYRPSNKPSKRYQVIAGDDLWIQDIHWQKGHRTDRRARQIINKRCRAFDKRVFRNGIWEFLNP